MINTINMVVDVQINMLVFPPKCVINSVRRKAIHGWLGIKGKSTIDFNMEVYLNASLLYVCP